MTTDTSRGAWPKQTGPGTREWAEEQIRLCGRRCVYNAPIRLERVNALLRANGFPEVQ